MAFTLWTLFEATLLILNAACILHEERFLMKYGWGANQNIQGFGEPPTIKSQILNLLRSIRTVMRIPLIFINLVTIFVKLILG
ncbi:immediate early response 3-interacting protein 1 [Phymastichus coffea]|uniref:immediate early response 3-interacting protein 1 n=1 Tax=Phymastichus coffea TaxID=108790 RepID=UPI00273C46B7|nr:immediate early response 3-interacting protein 1 [Phymastichus coffea]XP_058800112.1 immediate early response 3-interacting protein 1 [Phymastichus coffea]XP_058800113.1 immediate early response 3-interacting protein 1 [Phymastichus coffea]